MRPIKKEYQPAPYVPKDNWKERENPPDFVELAIQRSGYRGTKAALLRSIHYLSNNEKNHTGKCYASIKHLAKYLNLSERTIKRYIADMKEDGVLDIDPRAGKNRQNLYRLCSADSIPLGNDVAYSTRAPRWQHLKTDPDKASKQTAAIVLTFFKTLFTPAETQNGGDNAVTMTGDTQGTDGERIVPMTMSALSPNKAYEDSKSLNNNNTAIEQPNSFSSTAAPVAGWQEQNQNRKDTVVGNGSTNLTEVNLSFEAEPSSPEVNGPNSSSPEVFINSSPRELRSDPNPQYPVIKRGGPPAERQPSASGVGSRKAQEAPETHLSETELMWLAALTGKDLNQMIGV